MEMDPVKRRPMRADTLYLFLQIDWKAKRDIF